MQSKCIENIRGTMNNNIHKVSKPQHLMRILPQLPMKRDRTRGYMRKDNKSNWYSWSIRYGHRVVLRTADAYADQLNTEKNNSLTGYDTVIYRNFL